MDYYVHAQKNILRKIFWNKNLTPNQKTITLKREWAGETKAMKKHQQRYNIHIYTKPTVRKSLHLPQNTVGTIDDYATHKTVQVIANGNLQNRDFTFNKTKMPTEQVNTDPTASGTANVLHNRINVTGLKIMSITNNCPVEVTAKAIHNTLHALVMFFKSQQFQSLYKPSKTTLIETKIKKRKAELNQLENELGHC